MSSVFEKYECENQISINEFLERKAGEMTTLDTRGDAHEKVDKKKRYSQIIECLEIGQEMTAKEIAVMMMEKGYIPTTKDGYIIKSGTISKIAGKFYLSSVVDITNDKVKKNNNNGGIGIDLGLKYFATVSNGKIYKNINKSIGIKKIEKRLRREQRCFSRKYENLKRGDNIKRANIQKQKLKVQKLYHKLQNIRSDYVNKVIAEIVKTKPSYIAIEDLNVSGMMKNKYLAKSIASQKFYLFRKKLKWKCDENGIELRIVDRWYPSSKKCNCCGSIKNDLKLSDRVYKCNCGYVEDRDLNASLNLIDSLAYRIA